MNDRVFKEWWRKRTGSDGYMGQQRARRIRNCQRYVISPRRAAVMEERTDQILYAQICH
jgi:hypothetical protein